MQYEVKPMLNVNFGASAAFRRKLMNYVGILISAMMASSSFGAAVSPAKSDRMTWLPFRTEHRTFDYGILVLEAKIDDTDCLVQLDTGANYIFRANGSFSQHDIFRPAILEINGQKDNVLIPEELIKKIHQGRNESPVGSVGNALFERGTLLLKFATNRFKYIPGPVLHDDNDAESFDYFTPAGWQGGYIILPFSLEDKRKQYAMLDTGSSIFGIAPITKEKFDSLSKDDKYEFIAPSVKGEVHCEIATLNNDVTIGKVVLHKNVVGYCQNKILELGLNISAIVGLDGFRSGTLIIDYRSRKWKFTDE